MESTVKPGARCECRDDGLGRHSLIANAKFQCRRDAVRMVTVRGKRVYDFMGSYPEHAGVERIPMCAACAAWHEAKEAK